MSATIDQATAILELGADAINDARATVRTYETAIRVFGEKTARWTVAANRDVTDAGTSIAKWDIATDAPTLVLASVPGAGKTAEGARWVGIKGGRALRASDADRWRWGGGTPLESAVRASALFIDDLGRESDKGQSGSLLAEIICVRHDAGRRTLVASMVSSGRAGRDGLYPDHMLDRVGKWWVNLPKRPSRRGVEQQPDMTGLERARVIVSLTRHAESAVDRVVRANSGQIQALAECLGLDANVVAARADAIAKDADLALEMLASWLREMEGQS